MGDIKTTPDGETVGNLNEQMLNRRNQIASNYDEQRASDLQDLDGDPVASDFGLSEERPDHSDEDSDGPGDDRVDAEPKRWKIKVNGREMELTEAELIARAQKVESADQYLKSSIEAAKQSRKAVDLPVQDDPQKVDEDDLALVRALQMGSEDEAVQAIRKLRAKPSGPAPDALAQVVDERLSFRQAADWFTKEYNDLLEDPFLKKLVYERDSELASLDPALPYLDRLKAVGEEIREWKGKFGGSAAPKVATKAARKAQVANVPSAAGRQHVTEEEPDDDPVSVIAQMAKTRGQGRPVQH